MKKIIHFYFLILASNFIYADQWRIQPGRSNDIAIGANGSVWIISNTASFWGVYYTELEWFRMEYCGRRCSKNCGRSSWKSLGRK